MRGIGMEKDRRRFTVPDKCPLRRRLTRAPPLSITSLNGSDDLRHTLNRTEVGAEPKPGRPSRTKSDPVVQTFEASPIGAVDVEYLHVAVRFVDPVNNRIFSRARIHVA